MTMSCICVVFEKHPLEDSCQEAIPLPATTFDIFPVVVRSPPPRPPCGRRRIPVFLRVVSAMEAPPQAPIRIKASDVSLYTRRPPLAPSVPQKTVSALPCPSIDCSQMPWLPCGARFSLAHGRGVARLHNPSAGHLIREEVRTNQMGW